MGIVRARDDSCNNAGVRREEQTCKLAALENAVFVATGLITVGGVGAWPVFFEAQAVALKNWSRDGSIDERFRTLEGAMFAAIQDAALHISPNEVTGDDMNPTITVGGFERGIPVLLGRQFVLHERRRCLEVANGASIPLWS